MNRVFSLSVAAALLPLTTFAGEATFRERIEPVLRKQCYGCHSGKARSIKGGLRLDTAVGLRRGGESGPVVVPGKPDESLLIRALRYDDLEMPPSGRLAEEIVADFVRWVKEGANDPRTAGEEDAAHWSFQPIRRPSAPDVRNRAWGRNAIDAFVLRRLEKERIAPSSDADRTTLLRRLYLDLIGLPPDPIQVDAFLTDTSGLAFEKAVDQLLNSPHYGERWGRHWLDMARYADSNGYESDRPRPYAWRWRNWVLESLNADMPFDQFTTEQLAGDLIPEATLEQRVATGFHRNTLVNTEGGVDREEDRVKRTVDRTNTIGKVWMGLSLGCCQCHSHKYDPITQREYYSVYAFFNSLAEPDVPAPTVAQARNYRRAAAEHDAAHGPLLDAIRDYRSAAFTEFERSIPQLDRAWHLVSPTSTHSAAGMNLAVEDDLSIFVTGRNDVTDTYTITTTTSLQGVTALRVEVFAGDRLPKKGPGLAVNGNFVLTSVRVYAKPANSKTPGKGRYIPLKTARADFSQGGRQVTSVLGDDPNDGWAIYPEVGKNHWAIFGLSEPIAGDSPTRLTIEMDHQLHNDHNIGHFRLALATQPQPIPDGLPNAALLDVLAKQPDDRTGLEVKRLVRFFDFHDESLDALITAEDDHRKARPRPPEETTKAQTVAEMATPRVTQVHERGDFLSKGEVVHADVPSVLPPLKPRGEAPDRLDLARWLTSPDHPLTARVIVNRLWQHHFGRGLVVSDDDFGTQGELPTHPELLDWLASEFQASGWSLKHMHRLIVTSSTWRQSSWARPELAKRDPYNELLARQNRLRVEAEIVRDVALVASGLLDRSLGGPSVRPQQPADLTKLGFQKSVSWPLSTGADRYRRGMYTFFQRTVPYPMLVQFDVADSNASCTRRDRSNTPLQALTLWNDPVFVECAQALGRRIVHVAADRSFASFAKAGVRLCLARHASDEELGILADFVESRSSRYAADPQAAAALCGVEAASLSTEELTTLAAATSLARTLLNLDEFITRE